MKLTDYQQIIDGQLKHRNFSYEDLAAEYQTPLYLFDEDYFKEKVTAYRDAFKHPELEKAEVYKLVNLIVDEFKKTNPSIVCKELLGLSQPEKSSVPEARTAEYYKKRPCVKIVEDAALATEMILFAGEKK